MEIILASASPQRRELLKKIVEEFKIIPSHIDEDLFVSQEDPSEIAVILAVMKAEEIAKEYPKALVIGADTIVEMDGEIYGKPKDEEESVKNLKKFRGAVQKVITGVAIISKDKNISLADTEVSYVKMRGDITDNEVENYVKSGEGKDKAGSYAVQSPLEKDFLTGREKGDNFIEWIKGDYYNVVGLPLEKLRKMLEEAKKHYDPVKKFN